MYHTFLGARCEMIVNYMSRVTCHVSRGKLGIHIISHLTVQSSPRLRTGSPCCLSTGAASGGRGPHCWSSRPTPPSSSAPSSHSRPGCQTTSTGLESPGCSPTETPPRLSGHLPGLERTTSYCRAAWTPWWWGQVSHSPPIRLDTSSQIVEALVSG